MCIRACAHAHVCVCVCVCVISHHRISSELPSMDIIAHATQHYPRKLFSNIFGFMNDRWLTGHSSTAIKCKCELVQHSFQNPHIVILYSTYIHLSHNTHVLEQITSKRMRELSHFVWLSIQSAINLHQSREHERTGRRREEEREG